MTIEFEPKPGPDLLPVFYYGLITDTMMGYSMFESDRLLKTYSLGEDNLNPGVAYTSSVPGYFSIPDRLVLLEDKYTGDVAPQRFFFTPTINMRLTSDAMGGIFSGTQATLNWAYIPEDTLLTSTNSTLAAQGFVDHFNLSYDDFAQEQWERDDSALRELVQLFKLNGISKWIQDQGIDASLAGANGGWMEAYPISYTHTPTYTPGITATRWFTYSDGGSQYTQTISIYGGVDASTPVFYIQNNPLAQALINQVKIERVGDVWEIEFSDDFCPTAPGSLDSGGCPNEQVVAMAFKLAEILSVNGGFESGAPWAPWVQYSSGGYVLVYAGIGHTGDYAAYLGGYPNGTDYIYQDISIPADGIARLSYWSAVLLSTSSADIIDGNRKLQEQPLSTGASPPEYPDKPDSLADATDFLYVEIWDTSNNLLETLEILTDESPAGYWYPSSWDLSAYAGQTIRLRFSSTTDAADPITSFYLDDIRVEFGDFTPPIVTDVSLSPPDPVGPGQVEFEITFSEEMYRFLTPTVQMGLTAPYETYTLEPVTGPDTTNGFLNSDPSRWFGIYTFTSDMPEGEYHLSIAGCEDTWHNAMSTDKSYTFQVSKPPTETPTHTPTSTGTPTSTPTSTATPTQTPTNSATSTITPTPTATATSTATPSPTSTTTATGESLLKRLYLPILVKCKSACGH
jgi:hypothetical protein